MERSKTSNIFEDKILHRKMESDNNILKMSIFNVRNKRKKNNILNDIGRNINKQVKIDDIKNLDKRKIKSNVSNLL